MSSSHSSHSYRPPLDLINSPFLNKPSGRHWSTSELQWLHVDFTNDLPLFNKVQSPEFGLLEIDGRLAPDSALVEFLTEAFSKPWNEIIEDENPEGPYMGLQAVGKGRQKHLSTVLSSSPQGPPSSQISLSSQISPSAYKHPSSIPPSDARTQLGLSPPPNPPLFVSETQLSPPPQSGAHHRTPMDPTSSPFSAFKHLSQMRRTPTPAQQTSTPANPCFTPPHPITIPIQPTPETPMSPSRLIDRLISPTIISTAASDSTYNLETPSPQTVTTLKDIIEDMPEDDVVYAATNSLYLLRKAFSQVSKLLKTQVDVSSAEMMTLAVEASMCTTTPDVELSIIPDDDDERAVRIFAECKRLNHGMALDNILGQEVAHLLAQAEHHFKPPRRRRSEPQLLSPSITTFLISWHHMTGYITRLDVPAGYMPVYHDNLTMPHEPLRVKRSKMMNLKDSEARVEFLTVIATIALRRLARYSRYAEGVARIRKSRR